MNLYNLVRNIFASKRIYVVNIRSKQIHSLLLDRPVCKVDKILPKNRRIVNKKEASKLVKEEGYTYCYWCFESRKE